jgi:outer membrane protein assembly factor BamD
MIEAIRGKKTVLIFVFIAIFSLSGCGGWKDLWGRGDRTKITPEALYQRGFEAYQDGRYKKAIENFQRLRDEHPLSKLAIL